MNAPEKIRSLIEKLNRLMTCPSAARGEVCAAKERLEFLLKKYNLTLEECCADAKLRREWLCDYDWERDLLLAVCFFILNTARLHHYKRKRFLNRKAKSGKRSGWMPGLKGFVIGVDLTSAEWLDVSECYEYYREMLHPEMMGVGKKMKEMRRAANKLPKHTLTAFIVKFRIFSDAPEGGKKSSGSELSRADIAAIREMMSGMSGAQWKRPAGKVTAGSRELEYSAA